MRLTALLAGPALAVALAVTGCTGSGTPRPAGSASSPPGTGVPAAVPGGPAGTASPAPAPRETVPARVLPPRPAVALGRPADLGSGARAVVRATRATTSSGQGPGQVRGVPAVAFVLELTAGSEPLDLGGVVVDVSTGAARDPAPPVDGPPAEPFTGLLRPGARATATYVFAVPVTRRDQVRLVLSVGAERPAVTFEGPVLP